MENLENNTQENQTDVVLHPLLEYYEEPSNKFFSIMNGFRDSWNDAAADEFKDGVVEHARIVSAEYIYALQDLVNGYERILETANGLLNWKAGLGNRLSIIDIGMLIERQTSRIFFGRDDHRI